MLSLSLSNSNSFSSGNSFATSTFREARIWQWAGPDTSTDAICTLR